MMQKIKTNILLLFGLVALTACPSNSPDRVNAITPNQGPANPGANPPSGSTPGNQGQVDSIMKTIQCEFEGQRNSSSHFFSTNTSIPKTVALISLDSRIENPIDLRTKFLGLDIGKFGKISMQFVPAARTKSKTDTIILIDEGLNKNMRMSQSGFAGQAVKLEAEGDGMFVSITCKGTSQFKSGITTASKTNLFCHGSSNTPLSQEKQINVTIPLSSIQAGQEFTISETVSAKLDSAATTITFMGSLDPDYSPIVTATASLKSAATFRIMDIAKEQNSLAEIKITCSIQ